MSDNKAQTSGLSALEAKKRLAEFGPNRLARPYEVKFLAIVKEEVTEPMILLLLGVGVVYSLWGKLEDALTIFSIITVLTFVEVWNEFRAKKAIASLTQLAAPRTKVIRDGAATEIETEGVVPGDILLVGSGSRIAADARLVTAYSLQADESSLTGESLPVAKSSRRRDLRRNARRRRRRQERKSRRRASDRGSAGSPRWPRRSSRRKPRSSWP